MGEMSILDNAPRSATAVAVGPVKLLTLDGMALKELILQMPEIAFAIFPVLTHRVRDAEQRVG
jgi:CRP-like cAMP-binding protein